MVAERKNEVDYLVDLGTKKRLFHINLLKRYEDRDIVFHGRTSATCTVKAEEGKESENEDIPFVPLAKTQNYNDVEICQEVTPEQVESLSGLVATFKDIFSNQPGRTDLEVCHLELTTQAPIQVKQYPIPFAVQKAVDKEIDDMLQQGIIEKSVSQYSSPIVVVKKPDNTIRLCVDFRQVNKILRDDCEPIPRIDTMFGNVTKKRYFSKIDFAKGYWQIPMSEESKPITAFATPSGLYQYR